MPPYDGGTKLEALRDQFETLRKGGNYLLVGHGAGFVGCLSALKDHPEGLPQVFQGIGQAILLFGAGLLLGSLFWTLAMMIRIRVTKAIIAHEKPSRTWPTWFFNRSIEWLARIALLGSLFAFAFAIVLIMNRFSDAVPPEVMEWWLRLARGAGLSQ